MKEVEVPRKKIALLSRGKKDIECDCYVVGVCTWMSTCVQCLNSSGDRRATHGCRVQTPFGIVLKTLNKAGSTTFLFAFVLACL